MKMYDPLLYNIGIKKEKWNSNERNIFETIEKVYLLIPNTIDKYSAFYHYLGKLVDEITYNNVDYGWLSFGDLLDKYTFKYNNEDWYSKISKVINN